MGAEVTALIAIVASDDIAFDPARVKLKGFAHLWGNSPTDAGADRVLYCLVINGVVATALVGVVIDADGATFAFHHEAALLTAVGLIKGDQPLTELGLQDAR